jgi:hypothetical protein
MGHNRDFIFKDKEPAASMEKESFAGQPIQNSSYRLMHAGNSC